MPATTPNTLAALQAVQGLILANTGTTFAALSGADAARYRVARAVYIGAPKDFKDGYLPQCQLVPLGEQIALVGQQGRVEDAILVRLRVVVDFTDWWAAEQQVLSIRDQLLPLLATHLRAGASAGGAVLALVPPPEREHGSFATVTIGEVSYRTWEITLHLIQVYVPVGGYSG